MNLVLFFFIVIVSFVIVRIGAVAFQLTGLEWSLSKFQALSCFTGTGFTTRESEMIVGNLRRRRIATFLIVVGNAGFVAMIATFANSIRPPDYLTEIEIPYMHWIISSQLFPWVNLVLIILFLLIGKLLLSKTKLAKVIDRRIKKRLSKNKKARAVSFEQIVVSTGGYGLLSIMIEKGSPILNKTILEAGLRQEGIIVLVIERNGYAIPSPKFDTQILEGDDLTCFGPAEEIKRKLCID